MLSDYLEQQAPEKNWPKAKNNAGRCKEITKNQFCWCRDWAPDQAVEVSKVSDEVVGPAIVQQLLDGGGQTVGKLVAESPLSA